MGKKLIIPGADFSNSAISEIEIELVNAGTFYLYWGIDEYANNANLVWIESVQTLSGGKLYDVIPQDGKRVSCGVYEGIAIKGSTPLLTDKLNSSTALKSFKMSKLNRQMESLNMFKGMTNLESVALGNTEFLNLGDLFNGCGKLASVKGLFVKGQAGSRCTRAFLNCNSLKDIVIGGDTLTKVGNTNQMFAYCGNLETISIKYLDFSEALIDSGSWAYMFTYNMTKLTTIETNSASYLWLMARLAEAGFLFSIDTSTYTLNKVNTTGSGWTATQGTPNTSTMTLWDGTNTPISGTSYYVDGCSTYYFTYNQ